MTATTDNPRLRAWLDYISQQELPVFAHTARCMASISTYEESSALELSQVILRDSAMTARVLRMANSTFYNPAGRRIDTVSYAIVLLGFDAVRNLALSIALIDTVLSGERHEHAMQELARSIHAGVQAKQFALLTGDKQSEAIFIGAVLHRLGPITFWCFPNGRDTDLLAAYEEHKTAEAAERAVLGFTLNELTLALVEEWQLSSLLVSAMGEGRPEPRSQLMALGFAVADNVQEGWDSRSMANRYDELAALVGKRPEAVAAAVKENAEVALETLAEFGIEGSQVILPPDAGSEPPLGHVASSGENPQFAITRELTAMLSAGVELNTLLASVVEGIYRGLQADLVVLAFIDPKQQTLVAKLAIGHKRDVVLKQFAFATLPENDNIFAHIIHHKAPFHLQPAQPSPLLSLVTPQVSRCIGRQEFVAAPLMLGAQVKGLIYADRHLSLKPFNDNDVNGFVHFVDLATIGLNLLSKR